MSTSTASLRIVSALFAVLSGACAASRDIRTTEPRAESCGSVAGIELSTDGIACPPAEEVAAVVRALQARLGAAPDSFEGVRVAFTREWILCTGEMVAGCSRGDDAAVMIPDRQTGRLVRQDPTDLSEEATWERVYDWRRSLAHELGHIVRSRAGLPGDGTHRDKTFWMVAADTSSNTSLSASDPRRVAISRVNAVRLIARGEIE